MLWLMCIMEERIRITKQRGKYREQLADPDC